MIDYRIELLNLVSKDSTVKRCWGFIVYYLETLLWLHRVWSWKSEKYIEYRVFDCWFASPICGIQTFHTSSERF